jgi:hypothetical protein
MTRNDRIAEGMRRIQRERMERKPAIAGKPFYWWYKLYLRFRIVKERIIKP